MNFKYSEKKNLPPLSWCAIMTKHRETVEVFLGRMVESREDGFVSGVWDDLFEKFNFDENVYSCCSGAKILDGGGEIYYYNSSARKFIWH